jgi:hypothetical protein
MARTPVGPFSDFQQALEQTLFIVHGTYHGRAIFQKIEF